MTFNDGIQKCPGCGVTKLLQWSNAADLGTLYCSRDCALRRYWTTDLHNSLRMINNEIDRKTSGIGMTRKTVIGDNKQETP